MGIIYDESGEVNLSASRCCDSAHALERAELLAAQALRVLDAHGVPLGGRTWDEDIAILAETTGVELELEAVRRHTRRAER